MSNSKLVTYTKISPKRTHPRNAKIKKITIHHMAGNLTVQQCGEVFQTREASANYGIDNTGAVGLYVDEGDRAWSTSNGNNDHQAINIELANDGGDPDWHVSDRVIEKCIELCVDICKRNGIEKLNFTGNSRGNLTMHSYFAATACPGPYLKGKFKYIADSVNAILAGEVHTPEPLGAENKETESKQTDKTIAEQTSTAKTERTDTNTSAKPEQKSESENDKTSTPASSAIKEVKADNPAASFDKTIARKYKVTARSGLNIRNGAGMDHKIMIAIPYDHSVQCYGYYTDKDGRWLYISTDYNDKRYIGFVNRKWLL